MATAVARHVLRVPGRLCLDPTSLSGSFPYGGTALGLFRSVAVRPRVLTYEITAEEWGSQSVETIHCGSSVLVQATLRAYDADALDALFLDTATGVPSGDTVVRFRADQGRAGTKLSTIAGTLLFVPLAPIRHPAVLVHDAVPAVGQDVEVPFSARDEIGIPVAWYGRPDSSGRVADVGRIGDLSL